MRILITISSFNPTGSYGGSMTVAYNTAKELVKRGHEVSVYASDFVTRDSRTLSKHSEIEGIEVSYFKNLSNRIAWDYRLFLIPGIIPSLRKNIQNFDIVHINEHYCVHNIAISYYARKQGIPYVVQPHGAALTYFQKESSKKIFDNMFARRILDKATKVLVLNGDEAEKLREFGVSDKKIVLVSNGIDISEFQDLPHRGLFRRRLGIENEIMLLYLGRIHKAKGLDLLLSSFADVLKSQSDVKLVIVGPDDGFKNDLERQAKDLEISDSIFFTGPMYGADKLSAYVDSDIFILPSNYEAFGLTIIEAWACHVPVIITERCGIAKVASQGGLVVKHRKENLKEAILKLISDDKLRKALGDRGAELVTNRFNWKMIACDIESVYQECVNNKVK